ncbi:CU044_2847 family protein [Nonomuraea rubra]|uniref:CU044_2847 family protein n=1 Tax=Nonomuraea rubra TaxID=46180 RepID=UPI0033EE8F51
MSALFSFHLDQGGSVVVELPEPPGVSRAAGWKERVVEDTRLSFEKALANVRDAASAALAQFQEMSRRPDEVELKFGVKLDAKAGAVIAQTGLEGQFEVTLRWQAAPDDTATTGRGPRAPGERG